MTATTYIDHPHPQVKAADSDFTVVLYNQLHRYFRFWHLVLCSLVSADSARAAPLFAWRGGPTSDARSRSSTGPLRFLRQLRAPHSGGDVIQDEEKLLLASPERCRGRFDVQVHT